MGMDSNQLGVGDLSALGPMADWPTWRLFLAASRLTGPAWGRLLEQQGVSPAGFALLRMLYGQDGLRPGEVARQAMITPASVTSVADTLERRGQLERRRDDADRRAVRLHITPAGRAVVEETGHGMANQVRQMFGQVDPADEPAVRRFLLAAIDRLGEYLQGELP
jgi:DNA-binding MarR family transcriptional regulator